jgi:predicted  nucleic acid-binding Zn-ribbon protein
MTNEEFERLKDSLRAKQWNGKSNDADLEKATAAAKVARERRQLDRDMNRIERVLRRLADAPREPKRRPDEGRRSNEFKESFEKQHAQIRKFAARSDAKIKAIVEEMQRRNTRQP